MGKISSIEHLEACYGTPSERAVRKELDRLDQHMRAFIALSPFVLIGSSDGNGSADVSPRGEQPGAIEVLDDRRLLIPDRPGNQRLDTLRNLIANPAIGLLFLIPGVEETLRINGQAEIRDDEDLKALFSREGKLPTTVLLVHVQQAYLHCAKSIMRSRLWHSDARIDRSLLPTMGAMLKDHARLSGPAESEDEHRRRNLANLY